MGILGESSLSMDLPGQSDALFEDRSRIGIWLEIGFDIPHRNLSYSTRDSCCSATRMPAEIWPVHNLQEKDLCIDQSLQAGRQHMGLSLRRLLWLVQQGQVVYDVANCRDSQYVGSHSSDSKTRERVEDSDRKSVDLFTLHWLLR